MVSRRSWWGVVLAGALGGCATDVPAPDVAARDSAGVTIVVAAEPIDASLVELDPLPEMSLGGEEEGEDYLFRVADATRLSDGTVVVLDGGSREVRFFAPDGSLRFVTGREGQGPGEFDRFTSISPFRGDSLLVFDSWLKRASIYDQGGALGRVLSLDPSLQAVDLLPFGSDALLAVTWSYDAFLDIEGPYRMPYTILLLSASGQVQDTVATMAGFGGYKVGAGEDYRDAAPVIIEDGHLASNGDGAVFSSAERWELRRLDSRAEVDQIVRMPGRDRPLTAAEIDREKASMVRPTSSAEYRSMVNDMTVPALRPAFGDLLLAPNGRVWAAHYQSPRTENDDPTEWSVFDGSGSVVAPVTTPPRFTVFEVGEGYLLGVRRDDFDVEHVEVLRWTFQDPN